MNTKKLKRFDQGFTLIFVLVIIVLFSAVAITLSTRYNSSVQTAQRNAESAAVYYWQEGRQRLARYKFGIEMLNHPNYEWTKAEQKEVLDAIMKEVMPSDVPFDWRKTPEEDYGGYKSKQTYTGPLLPLSESPVKNMQ